jgi:hypothetical protein
MRPNPHDGTTEDDAARIIYLGEVRRRRASRQRQQPDHHYLAALGLVAATSWAVWLTVVFSLPPARLLTYLAFFVPLGLAIGATSAIGLHLADTRAGRVPGLRQSIRRGYLIAGVIVANLAFLAAGRWSVLVLGVSTLAALCIEVGTARREF